MFCVLGLKLLSKCMWRCYYFAFVQWYFWSILATWGTACCVFVPFLAVCLIYLFVVWVGFLVSFLAFNDFDEWQLHIYIFVYLTCFRRFPEARARGNHAWVHGSLGPWRHEKNRSGREIVFQGPGCPATFPRRPPPLAMEQSPGQDSQESFLYFQYCAFLDQRFLCRRLLVKVLTMVIW